MVCIDQILFDVLHGLFVSKEKKTTDQPEGRHGAQLKKKGAPRQ